VRGARDSDARPGHARTGYGWRRGCPLIERTARAVLFAGASKCTEVGGAQPNRARSDSKDSWPPNDTQALQAALPGSWSRSPRRQNCRIAEQARNCGAKEKRLPRGEPLADWWRFRDSVTSPLARAIGSSTPDRLAGRSIRVLKSVSAQALPDAPNENGPALRSRWCLVALQGLEPRTCGL
jgi:hypothetical protein